MQNGLIDRRGCSSGAVRWPVVALVSVAMIAPLAVATRADASDLDEDERRMVIAAAEQKVKQLADARNEKNKAFVSARNSEAVSYTDGVASVYITVRRNLDEHAEFELEQRDRRNEHRARRGRFRPCSQPGVCATRCHLAKLRDDVGVEQNHRSMSRPRSSTREKSASSPTSGICSSNSLSVAAGGGRSTCSRI